MSQSQTLTSTYTGGANNTTGVGVGGVGSYLFSSAPRAVAPTRVNNTHALGGGSVAQGMKIIEPTQDKEAREKTRRIKYRDPLLEGREDVTAGGGAENSGISQHIIQPNIMCDPRVKRGVTIGKPMVRHTTTTAACHRYRYRYRYRHTEYTAIIT